MKKAATQRPDLKLIVTSATMEAEKYSEYFNKCPVFTVRNARRQWERPGVVQGMKPDREMVRNRF